MKARKLFYFKERQGDITVEMVIWAVETTGERPHALKYRLYCGRNGECLVRYDNEAGKGDHRHYSFGEEVYRFESLEKLSADFREDVTRLTGWRWE